MKNSVIKVFAAFIGFVLVMAISGSLFSGLRLDLTEQKNLHPFRRHQTHFEPVGSTG